MQRWKLTIEYYGPDYCGWQRQAHCASVQEEIETALFKLSGEQRHVQGSGRTDSGVHALGQVAHVDLEKELSVKAVRDGLNHHLGHNRISILRAEPVSSEFDARFSALQRHYLYRILPRRSPTAIRQGQVWHLPYDQTLDVQAMNEAASYLIGYHDFSSFRASQCQAKSPMRSLDRLVVSQEGDEVHLQASARSFLHHQIRNFAGTLVRVGVGKWQPIQVKQALEAKNRGAAGETAPPEGLYFMKVDFDQPSVPYSHLKMPEVSGKSD